MKKPTDEQAAVIRKVLDAKRGDTLYINACAGAGKTTTLHMIASATKVRFPSARILYLVFNKQNRIEAASEFEGLADVSTAHSLAYRAMAGSFTLDPYGIRLTLIKELMQRNTDYGTKVLWLLARQVKQTMTDFFQSGDDNLGLKHIPEDFKAIVKAKELRDDYNMMCDSILSSAEYWIDYLRNRRLFDHAMYLKEYSLSHPDLGKNYDLILFDECQDANPPMESIVSNSSCVKVYVGDVYQHIYAFTGAANTLVSKPAETLSGVFRFGSEIAGCVNNFIARSPFKTTALELKGLSSDAGKVFTTYSDFESGVKADNPENVICTVCRYNHTIVTEALKLMSADKRVKIIGLETLSAGPLQRLRDLYVIVRNPSKPIRDLVDDPFLKTFTSISELQSYADNAYDINLSSSLEYVTKYKTNLERDIERIQSRCWDDSCDHMLVTAHKSKGLEFDNVALSDDFLPSGSAPSYLVDPIEYNLVYVAMTRAKHRLYIPEELGLYINDRLFLQHYADYAHKAMNRNLRSLGYGDKVRNNMNMRLNLFDSYSDVLDFFSADAASKPQIFDLIFSATDEV